MATAGDTAPRHVSVTAPASPRGTIALPASKSLSARALILDALTQSPGALHNLAVCDDTHAMLQALLSNQPHIAVGGAGTAMRFLTAYFSAQAGRRVTLDGDQRMRCRPIAPLVDALRQLGAHITYADREGFPPLHIEGRTLRGTHIVMPGDVSSQFISALLMIAPTIGGITLEITGDIVSRPYIDMTLAMMAQRGVNARWTGNAIVVPEGQYTAVDYTVEADWSAASYWLAWQALLPQAQLTLAGLQRDSLQGDQRMLALLENMGMSAHWTSGGLTLVAERCAQCCCSTFADLSGTPDLAPTLTVMLCLMGRPFRITGLRTLHLKESDRIDALCAELRKLGYVVKIEGNDALDWHFESCEPERMPRISTHGDHRLAMAFSLAAVRFPGIVVEDAAVVEKSYPNYWKHLQQAGFDISFAL